MSMTITRTHVLWVRLDNQLCSICMRLCAGLCRMNHDVRPRASKASDLNEVEPSMHKGVSAGGAAGYTLAAASLNHASSCAHTRSDL